MKKLSVYLLALALLCCALVFPASAEELPALPAPTDLTWGYDYINDQPLNGAISWKGIGRDDVYYEIDVYRDGESEMGNYLWPDDETESGWYTWYGFAGYQFPESGTYTFTITVWPTDSSAYSRNSAQSAEWVYVVPEKTMEPCINVSIDAEHIYVTAPEDTSNLGGYEVQIRYSEFSWMSRPDYENIISFSAEDAAAGVISWGGPGSVGHGVAGFYEVGVRMLSNDIHQVANTSEWVWSELYCYEYSVPEYQYPLLGRCTITAADENSVSWQLPEDSTYVGGYEMEVYASTDPESTPMRRTFVGRQSGTELEGCSWSLESLESALLEYYPDYFVDYEGYFFIMVRLTTNDWSEAQDSLWSDFSEPIYFSTKEPVPETVKGDMDGDGVLNDADVAQLLWHTLFPETYEVSGSADFNADGAVDDLDVAYLLWHTLFPEQYPLN